MSAAHNTPSARAKESPRDVIANSIVQKIREGGTQFLTELARREAPHNPVTKTRYRGFNWLSLSIAQAKMNTWDGRFMTFNNALDQEWPVMKGSKSTPIIFYSPLAPKKDKGDTKLTAKAKDAPKQETPAGAQPSEQPVKRPRSWVLKQYHVFHATQLTNCPPRQAPNKANDSATCDLVLAAFQHNGLGIRDFKVTLNPTPSYNVASDSIYMPPKQEFFSTGAYYATLFHELGHATGHKSRCDRFAAEKYGVTPEGDTLDTLSWDEKKAAYHREEFVAELTSAMLCAELEVPDHEQRMNNSAAYIEGYLKLFDGNPGEIYQACSKAKAAVDLTLRQTIDYAISQGVLQDHPTLAALHEQHTVEVAKAQGQDAGNSAEQEQEQGQEQEESASIPR